MKNVRLGVATLLSALALFSCESTRITPNTDPNRTTYSSPLEDEITLSIVGPFQDNTLNIGVDPRHTGTAFSITKVSDNTGIFDELLLTQHNVLGGDTVIPEGNEYARVVKVVSFTLPAENSIYTNVDNSTVNPGIEPLEIINLVFEMIEPVDKLILREEEQGNSGVHPYVGAIWDYKDKEDLVDFFRPNDRVFRASYISYIGSYQFEDGNGSNRFVVNQASNYVRGGLNLRNSIVINSVDEIIDPNGILPTRYRVNATIGNGEPLRTFDDSNGFSEGASLDISGEVSFYIGD